MNYLIVDNGIITNIIIADADFAAEIGAKEWYDGAEIGGTYEPPREPTIEEDIIETTLDLEARVAALELLGGES